MSIVRQGTLPVGSLDHAITLNVQSSGGSHFETVTTTTPYLHRASPQDVASSMKLKKVVGGTIAWNQLMDGYSYTANSGEKMQNFPSGVQIVAGHKLLMSVQTSGYPTTASLIYLFTRANNTNYTVALTIKKDRTSHGQIVVPTVGGTGGHANSNGDAWIYHGNKDVDISDLMIIDLTQMFGSTIADYIYSLEQGSAGDGVAWFKALFGEDYYSYNGGELLSVKTSARKTYNADNVEIGSYPLDDNLELRGIPKLDGNNELYYDGDTYASDGTVTRKYGIRAYTEGDATDGSTMITDGTNTVYKLTTSTTESADAYTESQRVGATEEFVDGRTVEMPVGNVSEYKRLIQGD